MKSAAFAAALMLASASAAGAGDSPFAAPAPDQAGSSAMALGDIMGQTQLRHIKLWYAGQSGHWDLVVYEIDRIQDSLGRAALLYGNLPLGLVNGALQPIGAMRKAAAADNAKAFMESYGELTQACNACHRAGGVGFIKIQTPTSLPFSDESFVK